MATIPKRQPAPKFWIADILNANHKKNEQGFNQYTIRGRAVIRANIIAGVIAIYQNEVGNYAMVTMDDGSAQIRLKAWNEDVPRLVKLEIGEIALIVGKINLDDMKNEIFIRPEVIRPVSMDWMELRIAELKREFKTPEQPKTTAAEEAPQVREELVEEMIYEPVAGVPLAVREKIIQAIGSNEGLGGAEMVSVIKNSGVSEAEAEAAISELIREGEAFQPKQGFIKLIS